jgi:hypothetical protein
LTPAQRIAIVRDRNENDSVTPHHGGRGRGGRGRYHYDGRGRNNQGRDGRGGPGRSISTVNVEHVDNAAMSQVTEAVTTIPNNAGQSFGRASYTRNTNNGNNRNNNNNSQANQTNARVSMITTGRRTVAKLHTSSNNHMSTPGIQGRLEIDNHADTHALGRNFSVLSFTGRICDVSPFVDHYKPTRGIEVVSAATAWDDPETLETIILVFHEALWMGDMMEHSLINPNQCRSYGISVCDDPYDKNRFLGMHDPVTDIRIPLFMYGTIAAVKTRTPSTQELSECRRIVMCSEAPWEPATVQLPQAAANQHSNDFVQLSATTTRMQSNDDPATSSLPELACPHIFTNRCIATVKVNFGNIISSKRHSSVSAEELARKWRIGLQTAKDTLKCTTQYATRHASVLAVL